MRSLVCLLLVACGDAGPAQNCTPEPCGNGQSYQQCVTPGSAQVRYVFGSDSCTCTAPACNDCATRVSAYCTGGGGTTGTNGGTTGGTTTNGGTTNTNGGTTGGNCRMGGSACASFTDCCSGTCANQICTSCAATGQSCTGGTACCGGLFCYQGVCGNCKADGSACNLASDCCSNICHLGTCQACTKAGSACSSSAECCGGVACTGGICGGPDGKCTSQPAAQCGQCCATSHSAGASRYDMLATSCMCTASTCQTTCMATVCASPAPQPPDQTCYDCFTSKCEGSTDATCMGDATCKPYVVCVNACPTM
jgi:hypothetical protein